MLRANDIRRVRASYRDPWDGRFLGGFDYPFDRKRIAELREMISVDLAFHSSRIGVRRAKLELEFVE